MTTTEQTIQNITDYITGTEIYDEEMLQGVDGVLYAYIDPGADTAYILTESGDLLVVDTDIIRIRTSEQMAASGMSARSIPPMLEAQLGVTINEDWSIA